MTEKGQTTYGNSWEGRESREVGVYTGKNVPWSRAFRELAVHLPASRTQTAQGQTQTTGKILCSQEGDCLSTETLAALPQALHEGLPSLF